MPELVELFLSGNPFCDPDGPMPHYYSAITAIVPELQIIDGVCIVCKFCLVCSAVLVYDSNTLVLITVKGNKM